MVINAENFSQWTYLRNFLNKRPNRMADMKGFFWGKIAQKSPYLEGKKKFKSPYFDHRFLHVTII